ncbi:MET10 Sulfite reductase [NADPH] flavoprotein component [Candida maltosa Xu316]|uniref:assimilatory sulfite reductase (NADPH) n=1 Tax=Candida maltosa (strain Xu316) TaxID=1245528 RepID=M3JW10_CANMX|nr:putative assimilatory sulfite reductase subunit [Candida maltosa Xu316]
MAPHAIQSPSKTGSEVDFSTSFSLVKANPFGFTTDPSQIKDSTYTSGTTIINQTVYSIASKIFSYETIADDNLLDSHIQSWLQYQRTNAFGIVPFYNKFQVRSGAANAILGYLKKNGTNGQPVSVFVGASGLNYMRSSLSGTTAKLPLALNVSAIDFKEDSLVSNYGEALNVARYLETPVFTPVDANDGLEIQHLAILNHFYAFFSGKPSVYLFDGPEFVKSFKKYENLLSTEQIFQIYQSLLDSATDETSIDAAFAALNKITGKQYSQFEYFGNENAKTVFVVYGTHQSTVLRQIVSKLDVGLVQIRVPVPFNQDKFAEIIPSSTKKLVVLSSNDGLMADVTAALFLSGKYHSLSIDEFNYALDFNWTPITVAKLLNEYVSLDFEKIFPVVKPVDEIITANTSPEGSYLFWGKDNGIIVDTADKLALSLSLDNTKNVSIRNVFDNSNGGGLFQSQIVSTSGQGKPVDAADVVVVEDLSILNYYDVLATAKPGASILYINHKASNLDELVEKLPLDFKKDLAKNHNKLLVVDFSIIEKLDEANSATKGFSGEFLLQLAFWRAALPELGGFVVNKLLQANGNSFELLGTVLDNFINSVDENQGIKEIAVAPEWIDLKEEKPETEGEKKEDQEVEEEEEEEEEVKELPFFPIETSFFPNPRNSVEEVEEVTNTTYKHLAQRITFPEAHNVSKSLRPDLPVKNFVVKVQENKRLTPSEYSRNIFHIEFDISGTGLTYDIGEALGIHGRNNSEAVEDFLKFYGVDGNSLVEVTNKDNAKILEIRSARQVLSESVDFLGKPPKRFYESLAEFATDSKEKEALTKLASAEGAEDLKKRQDVDFDSYFDILQEFKSARPAFEELVKIIAPLKRREYSIASSQKIHPNAVHLLIVVVDWVDPKGRLRYGHCSKYLSDLKIGDELVVSVKPSVMKLPPLSTQPIVMSGLGTGLAPFKAFIEEKIWQQQQGMEIGEIYLYLGSRHKKEEYLYGELWEAYKDAGILTHIGAAFSRDQPEKIYIQDRIRQSIEELTDAIVTKNGSFYLCGPTWPVPDITACLEDIVTNAAKKNGEEIKDVAKVVEDMKEDGRYILEVY